MKKILNQVEKIPLKNCDTNADKNQKGPIVHLCTVHWPDQPFSILTPCNTKKPSPTVMKTKLNKDS